MLLLTITTLYVSFFSKKLSCSTMVSASRKEFPVPVGSTRRRVTWRQM